MERAACRLGPRPLAAEHGPSPFARTRRVTTLTHLSPARRPAPARRPLPRRAARRATAGWRQSRRALLGHDGSGRRPEQGQA
eukprot:765447-Prymnesium_polylepis.1